MISVTMRIFATHEQKKLDGTNSSERRDQLLANEDDNDDATQEIQMPSPTDDNQNENNNHGNSTKSNNNDNDKDNLDLDSDRSRVDHGSLVSNSAVVQPFRLVFSELGED